MTTFATARRPRIEAARVARSARRLRRRFAAAACSAFVAAVVAPGIASAQAWPAQPVTIVVPFPPGGTTHALASALAERLSQGLGQPVIVENKPGANSTFGAHFVAEAKPDGYTLLLGAAHHTIAPALFKSLPYDVRKDFAPITTLALVPHVLVVHASTPVAGVADLVALAKAQPNQLSYGSAGNATAHHLAGAQFASQAKAQLRHVPLGGSGPMVGALLAGQVTMSFDTMAASLRHIRAGRLKALAVTTAQRTPALPDVPTLQEAGFKDFDIATWYGLLAPAATPREIVARLHAEAVKVVQAPDFRKRLEELGAQPVGNAPEQMARQIRDDVVRFARLVRKSKIRVE